MLWREGRPAGRLLGVTPAPQSEKTGPGYKVLRHHIDTHKRFPSRNKVASRAWEMPWRIEVGSKWSQRRLERNGKPNNGGEEPRDPSSGKPRTPHSQWRGLHTQEPHSHCFSHIKNTVSTSQLISYLLILRCFQYEC